MITFYIVPAFTDQAGQCRIVSKITESVFPPKYHENPEDWKEAGLMNSRGKLICLEATIQQSAEIVDCEPLYAGMVFSF